ncbi:hypothetical protein EC957_008773 [Mortierella hygrophila]|uniref:Uncharacterized protein n=1 Tax=Mortierella hygrophila TaxID=979708 RepID=A0A9P6EXC7_9FUNG|nr:hypothetical protein EC957_008773 [Mortierella hygrophila]
MAARRYNSIASHSLSSTEDLMPVEVSMFSEPIEFIPDSPQPLNDDPEIVEFTSATVELDSATVELASATVEFASATVEFASATVEPLPTPEPAFQSVPALPRFRSPSTDLAVVVVIVVDETYPLRAFSFIQHIYTSKPRTAFRLLTHDPQRLGEYVLSLGNPVLKERRVNEMNNDFREAILDDKSHYGDESYYSESYYGDGSHYSDDDTY